MAGLDNTNISIGSLLAGLVAFFMAVIGLAIMNPFMDIILGLMPAGNVYNVAVLIKWLVYFFAVLYLPYMFVFGKRLKEEG